MGVLWMPRVIGVLVLGAGLAAQPQVARPTPAEWREDLAYLWEHLEAVHVDPFHHVSRAELRREFQALAARADRAQRHEMIVGIAQLIAKLGPEDGHSELWIAPTNPAVGFHHLPVGFYRFADGFRVQVARDDHARLLGGRVLRIGGLDVEEAFARVATATSADNEHQRRVYRRPPTIPSRPTGSTARSVIPRAP